MRVRCASRRVAPVLVALAVAQPLAGCAAGSTTPDSGPRVSSTVVSSAALDAARTAFDNARLAVLTAAGSVLAGASALDAQDAQAAKGAYDPAARNESAAARAAAAAASAAGRLPELQVTDDSSSAALAAVRVAGMTAGQVAALAALGKAARGEVAAVTPLTGAWNGYRQLEAAQALWIMRAGAGYYPHTDDNLYDAQRAGQAYTVLVNPFRGTLDRDRATLASVSSGLTAARASTATALDAAQAAFR